MKKSWTLHIVSHKGSAPGIPPTYTVGIHRFQQHTGEGGAFPSVHHPSWQHLSAALDDVGVEEEHLAKFKAELDRKDTCSIPEILLDEAGVRRLGFTPQHVPASAFA